MTALPRMNKLPTIRLAVLGVLAMLLRSAAEEDRPQRSEDPATASARASSRPIEEIVVTAQKRPEFLQDIPISVAAVSGEDLAFRGVGELVDLQQQVPGLVYGLGSSGAQQMTVRGVGVDDQTSGIESPIATYVDGIYQVRTFRTATLGIDLERVEVLRGPQGTLFGRNATGGALNLVPGEPTGELFGKVKAGVGSFGHRTIQGVVSGSLVEELVAGRIAGSFEHGNGWVRNIVGDESISEKERALGRVAVQLTPFDSLKATLSVFGSKDWGPGVAPPAVNILVGSPDLEAQNTIFPPTQSMPETYVDGHHPHRAKYDRPFDGKARDFLGALNVQWDVAGVSLKSITGFQEHRIRQQWDSDGTARDLVFIDRIASSKAVSQELNVLGSMPWLTWLVGSHFMAEDFSSAYDPAELSAHGGGLGFTVNASGDEEVRSYAFFGDATVFLPGHMSAFGGLRFTHDNKDMLQSVLLRVGGVGPVSAPDMTCENLRFEDRFDNLSPRYGVQWQVTDDVVVYAKRSFGYNSGGHYFLSCENAYEPETLDTIEPGIKSTWLDGRLVANVAVYRNRFENFQVFKTIGTATEVINAPLAKMRGAEIELLVEPFDELSINAGISLLYARYAVFEDSDVTNPNAGVQDLGGNQMTQAPNHTVNVGIEYAWPVLRRWLGTGGLVPVTLRLRGEWYLTDDIVFRPYGGTGYGGAEDRQHGYSLLNALAAVTPADSGYELRFFGKNLADTDYYYFKFASQWGQRLGLGGPPRTFGAELTVSF